MKKIVAQAVAFCLLLTLGACSPKAEPQPLKVCSFNIRVSMHDGVDGSNSWFYRRHGAARFISEQDFDIVGMQEVTKRQAGFLMDTLGTIYDSYGIDRESGLPEGPSESMTILWKKERFALLDKGSFWLSETPDTVSLGWDACCKRLVSWVKLSDALNPSVPVYFFNTHFDHIGPVARYQSSLLTLDKMREILNVKSLDKVKGVVFLTADFNSSITDEALQPLVETLGDARADSPETDSHSTWHDYGTAEGTPIDHIFYLNANPLKFAVDTNGYGVPYISDHYPVFFECTYPAVDAK